MNSEQVLCQIKELCASVTNQNYNNILWQGYEYLTVLRDMGQSQEQVYQPLLDLYNYLEDGTAKDCVADLLDFVVGWCSPKLFIWKSDSSPSC